MFTHRRLVQFVSAVVIVTVLLSNLPFATASAQGAIWYVATTGSDANSCLSADSPCGTINRAIGKAVADDIVRVAVGTYTGTGEEVVLIDKNITLSGGWNASFTEQSGTSTIDGERAQRGITIPYSYPALIVTTTVERFTIQNGFGGSFGGGIHKSWGSLTLNDSMVINNVSTWMGGGIYNSGTLTINNTMISGNTAGQAGHTGGGGGAGIRHYQETLTLNNSTVSNNTLLGSFDGSGIDANGTILINNSTISGNMGSDGAGISTSFGTLILKNSTISFNQWYGILNRRADVILQNTIIAMNGPGRDCHNETVYDGTVTSHGYNLIGNGSTCTLTATTGDQVGSDANPINPLLRPLQDTGGPTLIHALMPGSPAIDAGNPAMSGSDESACLATDQRGVTRPQGDRCDIGAYEYAAPGSLARLVIQNGDEQQTAPNMAFTHPLTVAALDSQGSPVSGVSVTFTAPASGPSATFADTQDRNTTSITDADGVATASLLTANSLLGAYTVAASTSGVEAVYFNLQNKAWFVATGGSDSNSCSTPDSPCGTINGAIGKAAADEIVKVAAGTYTGTGNEVVLIDKDITLSGGWDQTFTSPNGSSIIDGQTMRRGVYVDWGWNNYPTNRVTASLDHFIIKNGWAGDGAGGGIANTGNLTITNSSIYNNFAAGGAGVWNSYDRILTLVNVTVSNNSASVSYGGIANDSGTVFLSNSTITANSGDLGAGIRSEYGMTYLKNTIIAGNLGNDCNGRGFSAQGNNLIGNNENCALMHNLSDDLVGTPAAPIDPRLDSLQDNGGSTFTHALLADSPAIDAGPDSCGPVDQRGVPRPQGDRCDIGAYELKGPIEITIGGNEINSYVLAFGGSKRVSFSGINNGPVKITDTTNTPLVAAERVIYKVRGVNTSFSEMMALPDQLLDTTYWLPWYNNVDLDTQLRIANVTANPATVQVTIGGVAMTPLNLAAGESTRVSYPNVNNGPVQIVSDQSVVAAERVIYKVNGVHTSFSEMMALPNSQLDTTYWLPWYNNKDLDTQLRIGNVSPTTATVHVSIAGHEVPDSPFTLPPGTSLRKSFSGINNGPVKIESDVPIVAAERVLYKVNGVNTSYSETMAFPNSQSDIIYWLPWYNNTNLDSQLRFTNVSSAQATIHIYVAGEEVTDSPLLLAAGASTRKSFAGINNGPLRIESDVPIVVSERVIYKVNGVNTSFSEMMALPNSQLDTIHWFPWYNNVDLDTQLRFGAP
jgi:hypothetical protein